MQTTEKDEPLASIVVLTYNSQHYLRETLNSLVRQKTSLPFEIIISDDGSKDHTMEILRDYQKSYECIKIFENETNLGILGNLKNAIGHSSGKYIAYCGHDDFWHDDAKLQDQVDFLEKNPEFGLVHTDFNVWDESTGRLIRNIHSLNKFKINQGNVTADLLDQYYIGSPTTCYRKDAFQKYVPVDDLIRLQIPLQDYPVNMSLSLHSKFGYINRSTATFRQRTDSISNPLDIVKMERFLDGIEKVNHYLHEKYPGKFVYNESRFLVCRYIGLLGTAIKLNDFEKAGYYAEQLKKYGVNSVSAFCTGNIFFFKLYRIVRYNKFLFRLYGMLYRVKTHSKSLHLRDFIRTN